jgi:hypothetical protein
VYIYTREYMSGLVALDELPPVHDESLFLACGVPERPRAGGIFQVTR